MSIRISQLEDKLQNFVEELAIKEKEREDNIDMF